MHWLPPPLANFTGMCAGSSDSESSHRMVSASLPHWPLWWGFGLSFVRTPGLLSYPSPSSWFYMLGQVLLYELSSNSSVLASSLPLVFGCSPWASLACSLVILVIDRLSTPSWRLFSQMDYFARIQIFDPQNDHALSLEILWNWRLHAPSHCIFKPLVATKHLEIHQVSGLLRLCGHLTNFLRSFRLIWSFDVRFQASDMIKFWSSFETAHGYFMSFHWRTSVEMTKQLCVPALYHGCW